MPAESAPGALKRDPWPWPRPLGRFIEAQNEADPHAVRVTVEPLHPLHCPRPCPLCGPTKASIDDDRGGQP